MQYTTNNSSAFKTSLFFLFLVLLKDNNESISEYDSICSCLLLLTSDNLLFFIQSIYNGEVGAINASFCLYIIPIKSQVQFFNGNNHNQ